MIGFPIVALIASAIGFSQSRDMLTFVPAERFLEVGATTSVTVMVQSSVPINVVGGSVVMPPEIAITSFSTNNSIVDLWTAEPQVGTVSQVDFSGGIIALGGFTGTGELFSFVIEARETGTAELLLEDPQILAHDGAGTSVFERSVPLTLVIREAGTPSPDLTNSNSVTIADLGILTTRLFTPYDTRYDLNGDGRVSTADLLVLMRHMRY